MSELWPGDSGDWIVKHIVQSFWMSRTLGVAMEDDQQCEESAPQQEQPEASRLMW